MGIDHLEDDDLACPADQPPEQKTLLAYPVVWIVTSQVLIPLAIFLVVRFAPSFLANPWIGLLITMGWFYLAMAPVWGIVSCRMNTPPIWLSVAAALLSVVVAAAPFAYVIIQSWQH